jgi:hypothetical protein
MKADKKDKGKKVANAETTDQAEQAAHTSKRNPEGIKKNEPNLKHQLKLKT